MRIIIDGLWGIGKTRISQLLEEEGFTFISEPKISDFNKNTHNDIITWFAREHLNNMRLLIREDNAILERSSLSNFLFRDQEDKEVPKEIEDIFKNNTIFAILFIIEDLLNYPEYLKKINHKIVNRHLSIADYKYYQDRMI